MSWPKQTIMPSLASSEGWKRMPAMVIQRLAPLTVVPITGTRASRISDAPRTRTEVRYQKK